MYQRAGCCDRRCRDWSCVVLLSNTRLQNIHANLWSERGTRNKGLGRLLVCLRVRGALGLVVWAGKEAGANGTATDPIMTFALLGI